MVSDKGISDLERGVGLYLFDNSFIRSSVCPKIVLPSEREPKFYYEADLQASFFSKKISETRAVFCNKITTD